MRKAVTKLVRECEVCLAGAHLRSSFFPPQDFSSVGLYMYSRRFFAASAARMKRDEPLMTKFVAVTSLLSKSCTRVM